MSKDILIVDPILRGSRLVNTSYAIAGFLEQGWQVHLLTRREAVTDHYRELLGDSSHRLHAVLPVPAEVWFDKLSVPLIRTCLAEMRDLGLKHQISTAFFTGWNEFFPALPFLLGWSAPLRQWRWSAIDYAPGCWLKEAGKSSGKEMLKALAKRLATRHALGRFPALQLLVMDERVVDPAATGLPASLRQRFRWIPDPAPAPRMESGPVVSPGLPTVLVVGLQTGRKGLADALSLIEQQGSDMPVRFRFVGRLADDTEGLRERLQRLPPSQFEWSEGFFPEAVIQRHYAEADFVIMPYTRDFDCSSAVLVTACAHGKPVITTAHGIIGFRVRRHALGFVYPSCDTLALAAVIKQLPPPGSQPYRTIAGNCRGFAAANSIEAFQKAVISGLCSSETTSATPRIPVAR